MKDFYSQYAGDELWFIKETEWVRTLQNIRESQFAQGNGYLGTRGILEEIPYDAIPGTYITGLYDKMGSQVDELVNLPNPINFRFTIKGEKLDVIAMDTIWHKRILNMKKAVLVRHTLYKDAKGRQYDYQSLRFLSFHNKNIGVMQIALTPLDAGCVLDINTGIDTSVSNMGGISEGRKRHFRVRELGQSHNAGYLVIDTLEKKHTVVFWAGFSYELNGRKIFAKDNVFRLRVKKNQTLIFTKIFCMKHFPYQENHSSYKNDAFKIFYKAFRTKFSILLDAHMGAWQKLWKRSDVVIAGTANLQQNLRFNIYHMLICAHCDEGLSSIGARSLSGEGYRGHIFWDAEIFLMPFYLFNLPRVAKNMLLYRYKRLNKARELAKKEGFKGAKFPWESAGVGTDETPAWAKDFDGTIIKIHTHQQEHHITADIAYAIYKYYVVTGDEKFMQRCGYEMIFEAARFWASRVQYNRKKKKYEINQVMGPDEFHRDVNNNAFTNMMAKWNLITAHRLFCTLKVKQSSVYKRLKGKLDLKEKEVASWKRTASAIAITIKKNKVIEQFDHFCRLKSVRLDRTDENGIPLIPASLKAKGLGKTQLVKQADVLMLLYLLDDVFSLRTKIANYNFYIQRTVHKSSLSPSIHAISAIEAGDLHRAYNLFNVSLRTDVSNLHGNTPEGIHAASLGGTWQAAVFGFAGIKVKKEKLFINPRMPRTWNTMIFSLLWRQNLVKLELTNHTIAIKAISSQKKPVEIGVFDRIMALKPNKRYVFERKVGRYKEGYHY
ncbi:MAG: glycoside hydrolase family 65 protein [Candidatus Omnitrophota bacterium]|nr:MAG: glycoside hydrolase family 65 protein [Candidatus Omnitrophota bacterium]